jgi:O-antigen/teichoic acid export membrane protein
VIKKDFFKASLIYTFSSALSTAASFLLLPFYTNTHLLDKSDFGVLSLYIGLSLLVQVIASFSIDAYVGVAYHEFKHDPKELKANIASLNGYLIVIGIIITLIAATSSNFFIQYYIKNANPAAARFVVMSVLTGIFNSHFKFYNNLLIHLERPWRYFWSNILNFVTTVLFSVTILKMYPQTLEGPLWGRFLSCLCIFLLSFYEITYNYGIAFHKRFIAPVLKFSVPLIITAIFQWILVYSDRYIIKPLLYNEQVAIFDLAVKCTQLVVFLLDGLVGAMAAKVYALLREDSEKYTAEINKYYSSFNIVMLVLIPLNILVLPIVLPLFISDKSYIIAFMYFGIICAGFLTRSVQNLFIFPIYYFRKTKLFIPINGISAFLQIGLGYFMVKYFQLYGAAYTLNIVKVVQLLLYLYYCRDMVSKKTNKVKLIVLPLVALIIASVPEPFIKGYGIQMHLFHLVELVAIFIITYAVYRNEIAGLIQWAVKTLRPAKELQS